MTALKMTWPASCHVITQPFGNKSDRYVSGYHTGVDIGCIQGSPIYAAHDGTVIFAGFNGAYGNEVQVRYDDALVTSYHHMSRVAAYKGDRISAGKVIGYIGSTGQSTGPHLHFEVRINGKAVDPMPYLSGGASVPGAINANNPLVPDVVETPAKAFIGVAAWLTETKNWYRIALLMSGFIIGLIAVVGMAKASALGKMAGQKVSDGVKAVKAKGKNGGGE